MKIIAIQGFSGSGKDTLANIIYEKEKSLGKSVIKLSFASSLKDAVSVIFNWDRNLLEGDTLESREWRENVDEWWSRKLNIPHLTPRWVLQNIGTDVMRCHFHPDIWLASIEKKILDLSEFTDVVIITDCRFTNEMECLRNLGAKFVKIGRGTEPDWVKQYLELDIEPIGVHQSEYLWLKNIFDFVIENNGTLEELREKLSNLS